MVKFNVKVYTTSTCPWCVKAKDFLKAHKVKYQEINVSTDEKGRKDMIEKSGQMGVPVIIVTKDEKELEPIVGFDKEALEEALEI